LSSSLVNFSFYILLRDLLICVIICHCDKWLPQHIPTYKGCYELKFFELDKSTNSCIRVTQENSIESSLQNNLLYILLQMVYARYCTSYPKWPCVKHEANMQCPCCMTSFCFRTFYFFLSSPMINTVTTPSDVTDVTLWQITSNPNPRVLKIEKWKIN